MGMTLVEKILAGAAKQDSVRAGQSITARPGSLVLGGRQMVEVFRQFLSTPDARVADPEQLVLVSNELAPSSDPAVRECHSLTREFVEKSGCGQVREIGNAGIGVVEVLERGLARPGSLMVGAEQGLKVGGVLGCLAVLKGSEALLKAVLSGSVDVIVPNTVSLRLRGTPGRWCSGTDIAFRVMSEWVKDDRREKVFEVSGPLADRLDIIDRLAFAQHTSVQGTGCTMFRPDEQALAWIRARTSVQVFPLMADADADYEKEVTMELNDLEPMVAHADALDQGRCLSEISDVGVDQVVIGGASGGRIEDLRVAAKLLKEHPVHSGTRLVILPGSQRTLLHAIEEGVAAALIRSGAVLSAPSSGFWGDQGMTTLGSGETALATSIPGSDPGSRQLYLASPAVAAATAVMGRIAHPDEVLRTQRKAV